MDPQPSAPTIDASSRRVMRLCCQSFGRNKSRKRFGGGNSALICCPPAAIASGLDHSRLNISTSNLGCVCLLTYFYTTSHITTNGVIRPLKPEQTPTSPSRRDGGKSGSSGGRD